MERDKQYEIQVKYTETKNKIYSSADQLVVVIHSWKLI
jgi:hypothetical protein